MVSGQLEAEVARLSSSLPGAPRRRLQAIIRRTVVNGPTRVSPRASGEPVGSTPRTSISSTPRASTAGAVSGAVGGASGDENASAALVARVATVSASSPDFEQARALVAVDCGFGAVTVCITPLVAQSLCSNGLWIFYHLSALSTRYSIDSSDIEPPGPPPELSSPTLRSDSLSESLKGAPLAEPSPLPWAVSPPLPAESSIESAGWGLEESKLPFSFLCRGHGDMTLLLHEAPYEAAATAGDASNERPLHAVLRSTALCEAVVLRPRLYYEMPVNCSVFGASVGSFRVLGREGPSATPVVLVTSELDADATGSAVGGGDRASRYSTGGLKPAQEFATVKVRSWDEPESRDSVASDSSVRRPLRTAKVGREGSSVSVRPDMEVTVRAEPMVVVLPARMVKRILDCAEASASALSEALATVVEEASTAVAYVAHAAAAQEQESLVALSLSLHGPLIVLPSPSFAGAVLLRLADIELTSSFERLPPEGQAGGGDDESPHSVRSLDLGDDVALERVKLRASNSRLVVARGGAAAGAAHALRPEGTHARPIFDNINIELRVERQHKLEPAWGLSRTYDGSRRGSSRRGELLAADERPELPPARIEVDLTSLSVSLAYSEGIFLASVASDLGAIFGEQLPDGADLEHEAVAAGSKGPLRNAPGEDSPEDGEEDEKDGDEEDEPPLLGRDWSYASSRRTSSSLGEAGSRVPMHVVVQAACMRLEILDDSAGAALPLYEVSMRGIVGDFALVLDDTALESNGPAGAATDQRSRRRSERRASGASDVSAAHYGDDEGGVA